MFFIVFLLYLIKKNKKSFIFRQSKTQNGINFPVISINTNFLEGRL